MERKLEEYLPDFLRGIKEYGAVMEAEQGEIEKLWEGVEAIQKNGFVPSSTENGIRRWETLLGIPRHLGEPLDDRRFRILTRLNERLPYTETILRQQLETLCGADGCTVKVDVQNYVLSVRVYVTSESRFREVKELTERMTPVNLAIDIGLSRRSVNKPVYYALTQMRRVRLGVSPDAGNRYGTCQVEQNVGVPTLESVKVFYGSADGIRKGGLECREP